MSMSGIDLRPGLRKRSKSRSLASGSRSVIVEGVGDDRAGRRAAARADGDAVLLGVADEVPDDQEVGGEAHLLDHAELELEPLERLGRRPGRRSGRAAPRRRSAAASPPAPRRPGSGSAAAAACPARSRRRSARRSRAWSAPPPATRRTTRPFPRSSSGRTRWCRSSASAPPGSTWSARRAAPRGCRSPRAAGSGRRRCRPAAGPARGRSGRSPRWPCPARRSRSSAPRSRPARGRRPGSGRRGGRGRRRARSSTRRRQKRDCRQPVSTITPSEWAASSSMSTLALPREKPSRKPAEVSLTRLAKPASFSASRVRWLRSYLGFSLIVLTSSTK